MPTSDAPAAAQAQAHPPRRRASRARRASPRGRASSALAGSTPPRRSSSAARPRPRARGRGATATNDAQQARRTRGSRIEPLSLKPAGLADGLALKELRYTWHHHAIRPNHPGSPAPRHRTGDSACGAQPSTGVGRLHVGSPEITAQFATFERLRYTLQWDGGAWGDAVVRPLPSGARASRSAPAVRRARDLGDRQLGLCRRAARVRVRAHPLARLGRRGGSRPVPPGARAQPVRRRHRRTNRADPADGGDGPRVHGLAGRPRDRRGDRGARGAGAPVRRR